MNPSRSRSGITRRLARVMFLQLIFISGITLLGVFVAAKVVEGVMMRAALEGEAEHFWYHFNIDQSHPLPNTDNLIGYMAGIYGKDSIPDGLKNIEPGYQRVAMEQTEVLVLAERKRVNNQLLTLYLVFDEESVSKLSFYFGVVPLSIALLVIYLSAWIGFGQSRKAISPLVRLANLLRNFKSQQNSMVELEVDYLRTDESDDEVNVLIDSLNNFTGQINQQLERERRFTRDASHEFRTPLAVIKGSAEFLARTPDLDTNQQKALGRIQKTVRDMSELVSSLLLLARSNTNAPAVTEVSINDIVTNQLEQLELTHNADRHVTVEVGQRQRIIVLASAQFAHAVIGNLLRNAFNYTRRGQVNVLIDEQFVEVCNKGEGVVPPADNSVFQPFVRGEQSGTTEGYGVGLDIVNRLCELYGWVVECEFSTVRGMIFRVRF